MQITVGKILGLVIALAYVVLVIANAGITDAFKVCLVLLMPLALIWFPDEFGSVTGYVGRHGAYIDTQTPPILVSIMGWFFLLGLPLLFYFAW